MGTTHQADAGWEAQAEPASACEFGQGDEIANITNGFYDPTDIYNSNAYDYQALQNLGLCCNPLHAAGGSPPQSSIALATFGNLHVQR